MSRISGRAFNEMREVSVKKNFIKHAEGSVLIQVGDTHVICAASVENKVPPFLRDKKTGWVTAEYSMLPRSTHTRMIRESSKGKVSGRTQEIQRLIGRSLRSVVDMDKLGERTIWIDCDVIQADGGTRTAAITGAYVALRRAFEKCVALGVLSAVPLNDHVAAVSCGLYQGQPILDLDYEEDSSADADANFVLTGSGDIVEVQGTAETGPFSEKAFLAMLKLAGKGVGELVALQKKALGEK